MPRLKIIPPVVPHVPQGSGIEGFNLSDIVEAERMGSGYYYMVISLDGGLSKRLAYLFNGSVAAASYSETVKLFPITAELVIK